MQLSALSTIEVILDVCTPRISFWKETILDAVGRCWVQLIDEEQENSIAPNGICRFFFEFGLVTLSFLFTEFGQRLRSNLKAQLQHLCVKLAEVCPSLIQVKNSFLNSQCISIFIKILGGIQTVHRG